MARIIDAFEQYFDDNGDPLGDGFLQFLESGTNNTDKDTFADISEKIANANPVPLDGAGRCPNVFGTGSYNVISYAEDPNNPGNPGQQIQQFDPVSGDAFQGALSSWNSATIYGEGDLVTGSDGNYYRSLTTNNQNQDPATSPGQWEEVQFLGVWNTNITYAANDLVLGSNGFIYTSRTAGNLANDPTTDTTNWRPGSNIRFVKGADLTTSDVAAGVLTLGTDGNYFDFTGTDTITSIVTGIGVGAVFKIHFDAAAILTDSADLELPGGANYTTAAGDEFEFIEYAAGDVRCTGYALASGQSIVDIGVITLGTPTATTTGTSIDYTSIPPGTKKITCMLEGFSTDGTSAYIIQIGDSGGVEISSYVGDAVNQTGGTANAYTSGFKLVTAATAGQIWTGRLILTLMDSSTNTWVGTGMMTVIGSTTSTYTMGSKSLSAELDRVRLTTTGGTDNFDAGKFNIQYGD